LLAAAEKVCGRAVPHESAARRPGACKFASANPLPTTGINAHAPP